jgi:predicted Fe-Mo cluster-binding NifX family protein
MKIAVPADGLNISARVQGRFGTASHLLGVDPGDMSFEALAGPPPSLGPGAGIHALSLVLGKGATVILAGCLSPNISDPFKKRGLKWSHRLPAASGKR